MSDRKKLTDSAHFEVVSLCARRCCMCFALNADFAQKAGQIAHLDQNAANDSGSNLAWLCLPHHDEYDSTTSQSKGYTSGEVKRYRELLQARVEAWRLEQASGSENAESIYKQQLINENTALFFFAAVGSQELSLRKQLLSRIADLNFKAQLAEAWAFLDTHEEKRQEAPSRQELMATYIGSTENGKEDLKTLLGLAGAFVSTLSERERNHALFEIHSDTVRSGLLLLHKLHTEHAEKGAGEV